jgi:hypothetical protein
LQSEFKRHKDTDNPVHIIGFLSQWKLYLDQLPTSPNGQNFSGLKMDPTVFEKVYMLLLLFVFGLSHTIILSKMSQEQLGQLYEMMHAAKDVWKPVEELEKGQQEKP